MSLQAPPSDSAARKAAGSPQAKSSRSKPKRAEAADSKSVPESKWSKSRLTRHLKRLWYAALVVSMILHLCGIGGLASIWVSNAMRDDSSTLDTQWETTDDEQLETLSEIEPTDAEEMSQLEQSMPVSMPLAESLQASEVPVSMLSSDIPSESPLQEMESGDLLADIGGEIGGGSRGTSSGGGGSFFGVEAQGKRFVYVVDRSGSMSTKVKTRSTEGKGRKRTRMEQVKLEMMKSISSLKPEHEFFIVFFDGKAHPMPSNVMVSARPVQRDRYLRWAAQVEPDGSTDPGTALEIAFRLGPDVIYLLTDGQFQGKTKRNLLALKQSRVHIHTIIIGDRSGEKDMKTIAENNGGSYTFIP